MAAGGANGGPTRLPQHAKIFIGLVGGISAGLLCNATVGGTPQLEWAIRTVINPIGQIFLRLIFMSVIPLIFAALTLGVAELGDVRRLGRIGARTFAFTAVVTTLSVVLGLTLVNVVRPGEGLPEASRQILLNTLTAQAVQTNVQHAAEAKSPVQALVDLIPRNPLADAVGAFDENYRGGGLLSVMFFSLFFGVALAMARSERTDVFERWLQGLYDVVMQIITLAMRFAPYGVAALVFSVVARVGVDVVVVLGKYVAVVLGGLALHQFVVYSLLLKFAAGVSPRWFFTNIQEVMITAFSTSSSNATLPTALRVTQERLKVPRHIASFVLTLGSTANQNGTALYEGVTVLFLAQFLGIHLSVGQQITVVLASVLAGIGTAGVPGGSLPLIVVVLQSVGVPGESIGIILGVDRLLDMARTVLNVTGDIAAATYVARAEGYDLGECDVV